MKRIILDWKANGYILSKYHHFEYCNSEQKYVPSPNRHVFDNIQEVISFVSRFDTSGFYFRGQNALWPLISSLFRHENTERWEQAKTIFESVGEWIIKNPLLSTTVKSENDALAIAQHYGCPTDLIDITSDIQTAAYFASSNNDEGYGCVWVFAPNDFERVEEIMPYMESSNNDEVLNILSKNKWSLLAKVNIPELSRLNAQQGAFLWDLGGVVQSVLRTIGFGIRLVFKHNTNERDELYKEHESKLFPLPNTLETEIMRILTEKKRIGSLPVFSGFSDDAYQRKIGNDWYDQFAKKSVFQAKRVNLNFDELNRFTPECGGYTWPLMKIHNNERIEQTDSLSYYINIQDIDAEKIEFGISSIITAYTNGISMLINVVVPKLGLLLESKLIYDATINLHNYGYSLKEIASVLCECIYLQKHLLAIRMIISANPEHSKEIFSMSKYPLERLNNEQSILLADDIYYELCSYFDSGLLKIAIFDGYISSRFYLPTEAIFLDDYCRAEFGNFCKSNNFNRSEYSEDFWIMIFQSNPQNIISYDNMKQLFIKYVLPHQLLFSPTHQQILIPNYVERMTICGMSEQSA